MKRYDNNVSALIFLICALLQVLIGDLMAAYFACCVALYAHWMHQLSNAVDDLLNDLEKIYN
jgi:divalent metal cation (Fe/Co/Zn/Cd) transporter